MNPYKLRAIYKYLTRAKKADPSLPDVFSASKAPIPQVKKNVETIEAINRFSRANPRVEKAGGGMLVQPGFGGTRQGYRKDKINMPPNRAGKFSSESIDNVSDAFLKSYANDDIQILFEKNKTNPNGLISAKDSKAGIFTKITTNENYLQAIVKNTGLEKETILNMIEDRDAFTALEKKVGSQDVRFADRKKFVAQAEKWLLNNGKRYADPVKFEKAFARTFGKNNLITKAIKANITGARDAGRPTINFSADFVSDIMGGAQGIDKETIKKGKAYAYNSTQLEQMFKTVIYNQNENVKNRILKTFENIMPEPGSKRTPDLRNIFNNNALLKKFGLNKSITGPIARLLAKEINENLLNNVKNFQKPFLGTTELIRFLKDRVNPKYKSMFEEAAKATSFAQKNNWPQAKEALNISDSIMFDHKIPKALVDAGYADEIEYIKLNPTSAEFNRTIKRTQFDQPMIKLTNEFERTKSLDAKVKVVEKMNKLKNKFSEKYGGYLDEVSIVPDKTGKPIFKSSAAPVTKQTDFVSSLGKSMVQAGEITQGKVEKILASFSNNPKCIVTFGKSKAAAEGGRIGYATGPASLTECAQDGARVFNEGKFKTADQVQDAAKLLRGGRAVVSGLMKYGIVPELAYVGLEAAGRTLLGEKPTNALLKSIDTLTFGATDFTSDIEAEKFGKFSDQKLTVDKFRNSQALVDSLQNKLTDLKNITDQGGEGYVGDLTSDIQMTQAQLQAAEQELQKNTVSSDLVQFIDRRGQEIADTQMAKSDFAKQSLKDQMEGIPGIRDYTDTESTRIFPAQPSQMDLNLNMFPTLPTDLMQYKTSDAISLAQALRKEGLKVSAKDILAYRDDLKQMPLSEQAKIYGDEQTYGTQGISAVPLNVDLTNYQPSNRFGSGSQQRPILYPEGRGTLAGGGIAKLAGIDQGPPPIKGPNSQGLLSLKNRVRNY